MIQFLYKFRYIIRVGHLIIAINIETFTDTEEFPILILSIFTQSSSITVKETFVFRNILYSDSTAFLT